jgi:NADPH:quinone reductase-like Zn-dependent oxidoreductase
VSESLDVQPGETILVNGAGGATGGMIVDWRRTGSPSCSTRVGHAARSSRPFGRSRVVVADEPAPEIVTAMQGDNAS